jgi:hypothetical protein
VRLPGTLFIVKATPQQILSPFVSGVMLFEILSAATMDAAATIDVLAIHAVLEFRFIFLYHRSPVI